MLLCVTDVLLHNLIWAAFDKDGQDVVRKRTECVDSLLETIINCGVTFNVRKLSKVTIYIMYMLID